MHSATKYLNGHSDVIAGSLTTARQDDFWQRVVATRSGDGITVGSGPVTIDAYIDFL